MEGRPLPSTPPRLVSVSISLAYFLLFCHSWLQIGSGTGITNLMSGTATLIQDNQELLVVKDKVGIPPVSLEWANPWNAMFFPSVLWHCWLGDRKASIRPVKHWALVCWWWWFDWSFARLIAPVVTTTSIILSFNKTGWRRSTWNNGC